MTSKTEKNVFMVLGFARSGTSVITRGLKALGIDLGDHIKEHKQKNRWNPTGFFEDEEVIYNINAKVYEQLSHRIRGIPIIEKDAFKHKNLSDLKNYATSILHQRFSNTDHWGFKNPSSAKIIPFWQSIFDAEHIKDHYIIALRNPLSSASSFAKLTDVDLEVGLLLWLTHIIPAIDETIGRKHIVVSYELMMQDPKKQLLRMKSLLNIQNSLEDIDSYTNEFLNKELHHHQFNDSDLITHPAIKITPLCFKVYDLLMKVASDKLNIESAEFFDSWKKIKDEFENYYPIYCYIDTLLKRNKEAQMKVRNIQKSIVWKLFYPIRWIDDLFRKIRVKKRTKKRLLTAYE